MERNCDNCNFGSYNLNCNDGKETLFCRESEYEREVNPTDVCESHQFIEGMEFDNKFFLKHLTLEQLKILILLVVQQHEKEEGYASYSKYYSSLNDISLKTNSKSQWDDGNMIYISATIGKGICYRPYFLINDYEIKMNDGNFHKEYNEVLQQFLSQIFGTEYIECLYQKKLAELDQEKENLISISEGPLLLKNLPNLNYK